MEVAVSENVFLKVSPTKCIFRFGKKEKLSPRSIRPFEILESVNAMTYKLALPPSLSCIPCVYTEQVSFNPSHVLDAQPVELREDMSYEVQLVEIMDCQVRRL